MSTGQALMTSAATGADCSAASHNGTPKFLQLLGKRVSQEPSGCGLTSGALVLNRNILSANKDGQRSTPTAEKKQLPLMLPLHLQSLQEKGLQPVDRTEQASVAHSCLPILSLSAFQTESLAIPFLYCTSRGHGPGSV